MYAMWMMFDVGRRERRRWEEKELLFDMLCEKVWIKHSTCTDKNDGDSFYYIIFIFIIQNEDIHSL